MILYILCKTDSKSFVLDGMTIRLPDKSEKQVTWDETDISVKSPLNDIVELRCKGAYLDEEYANGRIDEFGQAEIIALDLYAEDGTYFQIDEIEIDDNGIVMTMKNLTYSVSGN